MKLTPLLLMVALVATTTVSAAERTWTDRSGRFSVKAELVWVSDGQVKLKRIDGRVITLSVARLSAADQKFLKSKAAADDVVAAPVGVRAKKPKKERTLSRSERTRDVRLAMQGLLKLKARLQRDKRSVTGVALPAGSSVAKALPFLKRLPDLTSLDLKRCDVRDDDLAEVGKLTKLTSLRLDGTQITDAGVAHLQPLQNLKMLNLAETKITDAALAELKPLAQLTSLRLAATRCTDQGLKHLQALPQLLALDLSGTAVSDAGLPHLKPLGQLKWLALASTKCTNAGLKDVRALPQLQSLDLSGTSVTDTGIEQLGGLVHLSKLRAENTQVTWMGLKFLESLQRPRPKWAKRIEFYPPFLHHWGRLGDSTKNEDKIVFVPSGITSPWRRKGATKGVTGADVINTPSFAILFEGIQVANAGQGVGTGLMAEGVIYTHSSGTRKKYTYEFRWTMELSDRTTWHIRGFSRRFSQKQKYVIEFKDWRKAVIVNGRSFDLRYGKKFIAVKPNGVAREL